MSTQSDARISNLPELDKVNPYKTLVENTQEGILVNRFDAPAPEDLVRVATFVSGYRETICELGSGSGQHLIDLAKRSPETGHIGFEIRYKRAYRTIEKARAQGVTNLAMIRGDARFLSSYFPHCSLSGVYVLFPDPWDKRKWHKNRLVCDQLFDTLSVLLRADGFLFFKTDHLEYFDEVLTLLSPRRDFTVNRYERDIEVPTITDRPVSEFELLFRSKNERISLLEARRATNPQG